MNGSNRSAASSCTPHSHPADTGAPSTSERSSAQRITGRCCRSIKYTANARTSGPQHNRCTCSFREHTRGLVPADAAASLDDMLAHVHPSRDQINHLTHLSPDHDRRLHVRATPTAAHRSMHDRLVRVTTSKMRTRRARLLPWPATSHTCLGPPLRPLLPRTHPIQRRRPRTIRRILPSRLLQHRNPRLQQLHRHHQPGVQTTQLSYQTLIVSARIIRHPPIQPDRARRVVDPPEYLPQLILTGWR